MHEILPRQLDSQMRLTLPGNIRRLWHTESKTPDRLMIYPGPGCLCVVTLEEFAQIESRLMTSTGQDSRQLKRYVLGHARELFPDTRGRIRLPDSLTGPLELTGKQVWILNQTTRLTVISRNLLAAYLYRPSPPGTRGMIPIGYIPVLIKNSLTALDLNRTAADAVNGLEALFCRSGLRLMPVKNSLDPFAGVVYFPRLDAGEGARFLYLSLNPEMNQVTIMDIITAVGWLRKKKQDKVSLVHVRSLPFSSHDPAPDRVIELEMSDTDTEFLFQNTTPARAYHRKKGPVAAACRLYHLDGIRNAIDELTHRIGFEGSGSYRKHLQNNLRGMIGLQEYASGILPKTNESAEDFTKRLINGCRAYRKSGQDLKMLRTGDEFARAWHSGARTAEQSIWLPES